MFNIMFWAPCLLVLLSILAAFGEKNGTRSQQISRGVTDGLPFTRHLGVWSDFIIMPFVLGTIWQFRNDWSSTSIIISLLVGCGAAIFFMNVLWVKQAKQEQHLLGPKGVTLSGYLYEPYFVIALTLIILFFANTTSKSFPDELFVALLLAIHVLVGVIGVNYMKEGKGDLGGWLTVIGCWAALICAVIW